MKIPAQACLIRHQTVFAHHTKAKMVPWDRHWWSDIPDCSSELGYRMWKITDIMSPRYDPQEQYMRQLVILRRLRAAYLSDIFGSWSDLVMFGTP